MPKRRYERREPSHEWPQNQPLLKDMAYVQYEISHPVVFWGQTPRERGAETAVSSRTIYYRANLFDQAGMASRLLDAPPPPIPKQDKCSLPPDIRLGIAQTCFLPGEMITERFVIGHEVGDGVLKVAHPGAQLRSTYPAGGMVTSLTDLLRCARFHLHRGTTVDGARLLSEEAIAVMQKPYHARNQGGIGLAWEIDDLDGMCTIDHGEITTWQISSLHLLPSRQFALAILTNGSRGDLLIAGLVPWLYQQILGVVDLPPTFLDLLLVIISQFKGGYPTNETPGSPPQPPRRIAFCEKDHVMILDPPWKGSQLTFVQRPVVRLDIFKPAISCGNSEEKRW
ncbi:MAG TPA: hypothetical protein VF043_39895 [Ktedonobacteraceae bacterium]